MGLSLKVAVIGAGFAGLVAARELKREGHRVVVFEKANQVGGTWLYDPKVESDQLSLDPNRKIVHNSLYFSLRTNLPRQAMGFSDYPFRVREDGDPRTFPGHEEVQRFLNDFANDFGIVELIRFGNEVVCVERVDSEGEMWLVESKIGESELVTELFEAVVVSNGHYTVPIVAHIPVIEKWPGKQVHTHNYRHPAPFQNQKNKHVESGQVVVIIRSGPSAIDISSEIAKVAKEVHLSSRSRAIVSVSKVENYPNIWQHDNQNEDGMIEFEDSSSVLANTVLQCTGELFHLSGKLHLPCEEKMLADVEQHYQYMQEFGIPKHHTHLLGFKEFGYQNWLAAEIGVPQVDKRVTSLYKNTIEFFISQKEVLRDNFDLEKFST